MSSKKNDDRWILCEGEEKDLTQIAALEEEIFTDAWSEQALLKSLEHPQAFIITAKKQGIVRGYAVVYHVLDECEIARIAVSGVVRREGAGSLILEKVCEKCRTLGVRKMLLDVRISNDEAIGFYRAFGFAEDGVRRGFYSNPAEDALLMSRILS